MNNSDRSLSEEVSYQTFEEAIAEALLMAEFFNLAETGNPPLDSVPSPDLFPSAIQFCMFGSSFSTLPKGLVEVQVLNRDNRTRPGTG